MTIAQFKLDQFRCFDSWEATFHPTLNAIVGPNGSGKTAILEAIFFLAYGKSFRHRSPQALIQHNQNALTIQANCLSKGQLYHIALHRTQQNTSTLRENREKITKISNLSYRPAVCYIDSDLHRLYNRQSSERRKILDWGAFHYSSKYASHWRQYQRILKQRNAALLYAYSTNDVAVWNKQLSNASSIIHELRLKYFHALKPYFSQALESLCHFSEGVTLDYHPGWDTEKDLIELLDQQFHIDKKNLSTSLGPHRSDFSLQYQSKKISEFRSQGEQKILLYSLKMAQVMLLISEKPSPLIVLIDDIIAEIDIERQLKILNFLKDLPVQLLITCTSFEHLSRAIDQPDEQIIQLDKVTC